MNDSGATDHSTGAAAPAPGGAAAGGLARPARGGSPRQAARRRLSTALWVAVLALSAGAALAQPLAGGRMNPDERERLRRELREQPEQGRRGDAPGLRRERMSPRERDQLRQQLREVRPEQRRGQGRRRD